MVVTFSPVRGTTAVALIAIVSPVLAAGPRQFYEIQAVFVAPAAGEQTGSVSVTFVPRDPDVHINERPAARLHLAEDQMILVDKQAPPPPLEPIDPDAITYLDTRQPVLFPVAIAEGAPSGTHVVDAKVVYYFCSSRAGWCRRGNAQVRIAVTVP